MGTGKGCFLPCVRVLPIAFGHGIGRVRRVLQGVVIARPMPVFDLANLFPNCDERLAQPVELPARFTFRRFDHQGSRHGETHRRRVKSVVHESFGDIVDLDSCRLLEALGIDNEFMRAKS